MESTLTIDQSMRPSASASARTAAQLDGLTEADRAAVATWLPELRARLSRSAMSRVIDGRTLGDPGGWGVKNDLRWSR